MDGAVCYRHPNRPTSVRCQNCEKPICPDCMRDTPVGFRCPDCAGKSRPIFRDDLLVTKTLIGICVAVYLIQLAMGITDGRGAGGIMSVSGSNELFLRGALQANVVAINHDWWRPVTSGFLHAGLIHIAFNSFFIYSFGQLLEPALGRVKFALLYFVGMMGGAVGALLLTDPNVATVGASGAGFGLLGASLVMARIRRNEQLASQLMMLALINFAITFALPGISLGGHLGGFVAGGLVGYLAYGPLMRKDMVLRGVLVALMIGLFVASLLAADVRAIDPTPFLGNGA